VQPSHRIFEWGGGGSTLFFLKKGCRVTTVESSAEWVQELEQQIRALGPAARSRWDLRFVAIADNNDPAVPKYIGQVADGAPWDLVMVDGWSRMKCLLEGMSYVKPGGVLVLDNANQKQFDSVPDVMKQWQRHKFRGLGVARSWVTQTDAYVRPRGDVATVSAIEGAGVAKV
jgi:predicted O-methyltransferase YrrM